MGQGRAKGTPGNILGAKGRLASFIKVFSERIPDALNYIKINKLVLILYVI